MSDPILKAALDYGRMGWAVFPTGGPGNTTKTPHPKIGRWSEVSSSDPEAIAAVFAGLEGPLGIGLDCGKSGLVAFDVDRPELEDWITDDVGAVNPWIHHGNRNRYTMVCRQEGGIRCPPQPWGEVKGAGGYVVLAPTPHWDTSGDIAVESGFNYEWVDRPGDRPPEAPAKVVDHFTSHHQPADETDNATVEAFLDTYTDNLAPGAIKIPLGIIRDAAAKGENLHPAVTKALPMALEDSMVGAYPARTALTAIKTEWAAGYQTQKRPRRANEREWRRLVRWAVGRALTKTEAELRSKADNLGLGEPPDDLEETGRRPVLTWSHTIRTEGVRWVWEGRFTVGTLALLSGDVGQGKSTLAAHLAARVTQGTLEGEWYGRPRGVLIVAPEESRKTIIVPRFKVNGGDLHRLAFLNIEADDVLTELDLPMDLGHLEAIVRANDIGLVILDPLSSRLSSAIDTNNETQTRAALELIAATVERTETLALGLIHQHKALTDDLINRLMGSKAFAQVARSIALVGPHPEHPELRVFGALKESQDRLNLVTKAFEVVGVPFTADDGSTSTRGRLEWRDDIAVPIRNLMAGNATERKEGSDCAKLVRAVFLDNGLELSRQELLKVTKAEGYSPRAVDYALTFLGVTRTHGSRPGKPGQPPVRQTVYTLPFP